MTTVNDIIVELENFAPKSLAEDWDSIGLMFGSKDKVVDKIMVALDLDRDTLNEAMEKNVDLIVTHHPPIFKALNTLNKEDAHRREFIELVKSDIALYALHTNLDSAEGGMNDWLADAIGLSENREIVEVTNLSEFFKLNVFVPKHSTKSVVNALFDAGAGQVGDYNDVYYRTQGFGHFTPGAGADPSEGDIGQPEKVSEEKIEVMVPEENVNTMIKALIQAHPYEEPVYDLYKLEGKEKQYGLGRVGELRTTTLDLADKIKEIFNIDGLRYGSLHPNEEKTKVAIFGGAGAGYYKSALNKGAQIYVTGDISYHDAQSMIRDGIDFIDAGHYIEQIMAPKLAEKLNEFKEANSWDIEIFASQNQTDMFTFK